MNTADSVTAPIEGAEHYQTGGIEVDAVRVGGARVKRLIYPPGFRWSTHVKPVVGTDVCMHAHVGFLARGEIHVQYEDGCILKLAAPRVVSVSPGHDAWVVGNEPAVLIEFDFGSSTAERIGIAAAHRHNGSS